MSHSKKLEKVPSAPCCLRHSDKWGANVQWMLNQLREKLIKRVYIGRFNNLLCTCGQVAKYHPQLDTAWEEVSEVQLGEAYSFIVNHVEQNQDNEVVKVIKRIMKLLREDKEIPAEGASLKEWPTRNTSAFRLLYLLRKAIERDFGIMEPGKVTPVQQAKKKMKEEYTIKVELDDYPPALLGQLIGDRGRNIMRFMKSEKCHVKLENADEKIVATIKKTAKKKEDLEPLIGKLKEYAEDTKKEVESYVPFGDDENDSDNGDEADMDKEDEVPSTLGTIVSGQISGLSISSDSPSGQTGTGHCSKGTRGDSASTDPGEPEAKKSKTV